MQYAILQTNSVPNSKKEEKGKRYYYNYILL